MKNKFLNFLYYHLFSIITAIFLTFIALFLINQSIILKDSAVVEIKGSQNIENRHLGNCVNNEIELVGSLSNKNYISLFGSSELTNASPYQPYNFFQDSLHFPLIAFGHAYQQSFAIYCEVLAMQKYIKNSNVCIILSPGWFETEGTNIEAFLEFVRPNFLRSIIHNQNIDNNDKLEVGKYISAKISDVENPSDEMIYLKNLTQNYFLINKIKKNLLLMNIPNINYNVKHTVLNKTTSPAINWGSSMKKSQKSFKDSTSSNNFYIKDTYYKTYLLDENGKYKHAYTNKINPSTNREFKDFKLLIQFLKKQKCNASFIITPLNPFHYKDLKNYNEIIGLIKQEITQCEFPYLDLFVTDEKKYEPGTLLDIMHVGDYGWIKINNFIYETYKNKIEHE